MVFCSVPDLETGRKLADILLREKAAACVSILPGVESQYVWQGKREKSAELLLLIKTLSVNYDRIEKILLAEHPYDCPEIVAVGMERVESGYHAWLRGGI